MVYHYNIKRFASFFEFAGPVNISTGWFEVAGSGCDKARWNKRSTSMARIYILLGIDHGTGYASRLIVPTRCGWRG